MPSSGPNSTPYTGATIVQDKPPAKSWLDWTHWEWDMCSPQWCYARDHYTGACVGNDKIRSYLVRKALGETPEAYEERVQLADYTPHFGAIVDSLVGMLFQSESDATRDYGSLGDPLNPVQPIGKLQVDADGAGHGYSTVWKLLAIELTAIHKCWVLVDGGKAGGRSSIRVLPAESVINWRYEGGTLVEALLLEKVDTRGSLKDAPKRQDQYVRFTVDGWERYAKDKDGNEVDLGQAGTYYYEDLQGQRTLPIFPVELPLQRPVGYLLARKANAIFNQESARDHGLRFACFPMLNVTGNDQTFKKVVEALKSGARALQNMPNAAPHGFIAPSGEPARVLTDVLKRKVEEFWVSGFREYGDSAVEKTAAEVRQDVASGVGAFLQLLKAAVDDAENQALWRLEQTYWPDDKSKWFTARVERSDDFVPFDVNATIERLRTRYFGQSAVVPIGRTGKAAAVKQIVEWDGLETTEAEVLAAIDMAVIAEHVETMRELSVPAAAKADMTVRFLVDTGYVDPTATETMGDGTKRPTVDVLRERAMAIAQQQETDALRASAAMGMPPELPAGM